MSQRGHAPRHGGPAMAGEKAKNFKGSSKRLLKFLWTTSARFKRSNSF